jgi:hypothetical protein
MSEFRNPNDPMGRDNPYDLNARQGGAWTWIAGAVLVVILVAFAFGINHVQNNTGPNMAANNPPTMNQPAPQPTGPASHAFTPSPVNPTPGSPMAPVKP